MKNSCQEEIVGVGKDKNKLNPETNVREEIRGRAQKSGEDFEKNWEEA